MKSTIVDLFKLSGKGALVTGAGKGIGRAIAEHLAEAGASVLVTDVDVRSAEAVADGIRSVGRNAVALAADAANVADADLAARTAIDRFGTLDILVNNAGIFPSSPVLETHEGLWDKVLDVNLKGAFFYAQAAARVMTRQGRGGSIINIASIDAIHPSGDLAHYDASKGGLIMLTKSLALELAPAGIRVNAICPGAIRTPGATETMKHMGRGDAAAIEQAFMARIPMRRMGGPEEIAAPVVFLASAAASYVTGGVLVVDGGYLVA